MDPYFKMEKKINQMITGILRVESPLRIPKNHLPMTPLTRLQGNSHRLGASQRISPKEVVHCFPWVCMDKQPNPQSSTGYFLCIRYIQSWKSYCCFFCCSRLQHSTTVLPDETCNLPSVICWRLSLVTYDSSSIISTKISRTLFHWGVVE